MNDICWLIRRICRNWCSIISVAFNGIVIGLIIGALIIWHDYEVLQMVQIHSPVFKDLCVQIALTSVIIGTSIALLIKIFRSSLPKNPSKTKEIESASLTTVVGLPSEDKTWVDTLIKIITPVSATLFFLYQAIAGSLFATTSITVKGDRCNDAGKLLVTATIERGDNWLAAIAVDEYQLSEDEKRVGQIVPERWHFPRKSDDLLYLAPHEKTATQFIWTVPEDSKHDLFLTMSVHSYAKFWPITSESFARAVIPAVMPVAKDKKSVMLVAEGKKESVCENKGKDKE